MDSSALPAGVVTCAVYDRDGRRRDIPVASISDALASDDGSFVWLGLYEPGADLLASLQEEFGLHELAVEDAHKAHQRPKIEAYGDSLFVAVHTVQRIDDAVRFGETQLFVGRRFLVTVRHGASLSYAPVRARCEREPRLLGLGPAYAAYAVLDFIVDNFQPIVQEYQDDLDRLERAIFSANYRNETIKRLYRLKRELIRTRMAVSPLLDIVSALSRSYADMIPREIRPYYRDVHDHVVRVNDAIDVQREMLTAAMNVNLSLVTVAQGEIVKRLAGWAALAAVPTLIASWYGMNFEHMPELGGRWSYAVAIALTVAIAGGLYVVLRRARWL
ncbi:magnesium/cobalt transporter CorA [Coralloluteibacterium thermophilus]|uniref:Magnesium transport protein CorA n=1 Tax=Coralloluteibacterium thermophilum TaxID=2707049 RepID=A0ABV9NKZ4_9GAMM